MKTATVNRLRGVERDIVQTPQADDVAPYYEPQGNEIAVFEAAYKKRLPVMLKGPTGCGKTRFLEYMAFQLKRPLVTVSCHEDLTSSDLVGRFLLEGAETVWQDGPLTRAVKAGAICYLDEIVEARTDSTVIIHSLTDHRRRLTIEKKGQEIDAHDDFMLVISYNPGYQTVLKDLKPSTKQRFVALHFDFPTEEIERKIVINEVPGISADIAHQLVAPPQGPRSRGSELDARAGVRGQHDQRGPRPGCRLPGGDGQPDHRRSGARRGADGSGAGALRLTCGSDPGHGNTRTHTE
jgi:nitric oxide reductase NorQ protein